MNATAVPRPRRVSFRPARRGWPALWLVLLWPCLAQPAHGQARTVGDAGAERLRAELAELRAQQARIVALQRENAAGIARLERLIGIEAEADPASGSDEVAAVAPAAAPGAPATSAATLASTPDPRVGISGDLRLRHERNFSQGDGAHRNRGALRGRIAATYALSDRITVGSRLVTGNLDDPRSTGVTLSNFNDDFEVGLDRLYGRFAFGGTTVFGGKFANPFRSSGLVWDSDVNPQGLSVDHRWDLAHGGGVRATGLYFAVDEQSAGDDSHMLGAQLGYESGSGGDWRHQAHVAYYHYMLDSLAGAGASDFRTNLRSADGGYLSEFQLADLIVGLSYAGWGERWPLHLNGELVRNLGAATDADTGYALDAVVGRGTRARDWRFRYGYQVAETDAVLAAFSHDDTTLATNYRQHTLAMDYLLRPDVALNLTWYRFRPDNAQDTPAFDPHAWLNRVRLNLLLKF